MLGAFHKGCITLVSSDFVPRLFIQSRGWAYEESDVPCGDARMSPQGYPNVAIHSRFVGRQIGPLQDHLHTIREAKLQRQEVTLTSAGSRRLMESS